MNIDNYLLYYPLTFNNFMIDHYCLSIFQHLVIQASSNMKDVTRDLFLFWIQGFASFVMLVACERFTARPRILSMRRIKRVIRIYPKHCYQYYDTKSDEIIVIMSNHFQSFDKYIRRVSYQF